MAFDNFLGAVGKASSMVASEIVGQIAAHANVAHDESYGTGGSSLSPEMGP
jgi:hypothetical protein